MRVFRGDAAAVDGDCELMIVACLKWSCELQQELLWKLRTSRIPRPTKTARLNDRNAILLRRNPLT